MRNYAMALRSPSKQSNQAVDLHQIEETVLLFYRFQCFLYSERIEKSNNFRLSSVVAFKKLALSSQATISCRMDMKKFQQPPYSYFRFYGGCLILCTDERTLNCRLGHL